MKLVQCIHMILKDLHCSWDDHEALDEKDHAQSVCLSVGE